ncbi:MAG: cation:proton antiporter [Cellulomonas sp.]|uniref:Na+/H+ antiporter n=1 Tax=Cellulomonas gelida TaxID=1712 RepID=A0A4Y3KH70_9CELL|nr:MULTISPECIES: cation:proton antiporter [Cellulomonas]MCR6646664.1 cation:proton antiporter [Cellulomonas sp.]MCR6705903.1 cation:proton antiporter [Cellulomonas sp.]GEA83347.1 Na+/H+ antiporter [Cellulomonas gelida]GGL13770.1 Na+/H+ antiporter [Cellulomonas gelida]
MHHVAVFALAVGAVLVAAVCRRRGWPAPLVVVAVALLVSLIPGVPRYEVEPELLLEFVLPPLLYSAALSSSYRDFRASLNSITRLGVGLVIVTALAVALTFSLLDDVSVAAALVLGAVVAPPDAVAAAAVGRRLGLPRRVMTLLSGESLINDATSLTLYKVALAGVASGAWALGAGLATFAMAVVAGVGTGLVLAFVVHQVRMRLDDPVVASAVGLMTPFAAYWGAEALAGSGVLAVVAAGLYLGHTSPRAGYATRLFEEPIWSTLDLVLESFTFALIGMQLPWVVRDVVDSDQGFAHGLTVSLVVLVVALLVRPVYIFATTWFDDIRLPGSHRPERDSLSARESAVVSWAGMRGVVTLAAAAAIPATMDGAPFEHRATIQLAAYTVALGTLLLQGLTLPWVITRLGVGSAQEEAADAKQEAAMRVATAEAVQRYFEEQRPQLAATMGDERAQQVVERLSAGWRARAAAAAVMLDPDSADDLGLDPEAVRGPARGLDVLAARGKSSADAGRRMQSVRRSVIAAQREVLMHHRDAGDLDEVVMRRMMRELDLEEESLASSWVSRLRD